MELKAYQAKVLQDIDRYLGAVDQTRSLPEGWKQYWEEQGVTVGAGGIPSYHNDLQGVPEVTVKVPTGGGKTFIACSALKTIFAHLPQERPQAVVWLVPSDSILAQTEHSLMEAGHPYHERLLQDFHGRVAVYKKEQLLMGENFTPDTVRTQLSVCILSYASLRIDSKKKEARKVFEENGRLFRFKNAFADDADTLKEASDLSLMHVLRCLRPVVVVDESHNATSDLSREMVANLNPSFVLDLTATPRKGSNIISYVDARELKKESMVKLPVIVYNRVRRQMVFEDAIQLRARLEAIAKEHEAKGGAYIRPIVLFQAQPKKGEESVTFDKIRSLLIKMGIPEQQIAVKTSQTDTLGDTNLLSKDCKIRFIITVNALKEGWDCPFAYILASLANKTSRVDVEQVLGRILRQPYARKHSPDLLNLSYVLTSSQDFHQTLASVVAGLNASGFSGKDYRIGAEEPAAPTEDKPSPVPLDLQDETDGKEPTAEEPTAGTPTDEDTDDFSDIHPEEPKTPSPAQDNETSRTDEMLGQASKQNEEYEEGQDGKDGGRTGGISDMMHQYEVQEKYRDDVRDLALPQFCCDDEASLFSDESVRLLTKEDLREGFSLAGQDAQVDFQLSAGDVYKVDLRTQGEAVPQYLRITASDQKRFEEHLASLPPEERKKQAVASIIQQINLKDGYGTKDIEDYVNRVVSGMSSDEVSIMESSPSACGSKIMAKIETLEQAYRWKTFKKRLDSGKISCRPWYRLQDTISIQEATDSIPCSLYEAEWDKMNDFERKVIDTLVASNRVRWWHRIIERKGFFINGPLRHNHYPDFLVRTNSGKTLLVEAKGDHLDGSDSKDKLKLGRYWQEKAGEDFRYFMVFENKDAGLDGAYSLDSFMDVLKEL
jgi:type III restriction enzyme